MDQGKENEDRCGNQEKRLSCRTNFERSCKKVSGKLCWDEPIETCKVVSDCFLQSEEEVFDKNKRGKSKNEVHKMYERNSDEYSTQRHRTDLNPQAKDVIYKRIRRSLSSKSKLLSKKSIKLGKLGKKRGKKRLKSLIKRAKSIKRLGRKLAKKRKIWRVKTKPKRLKYRLKALRKARRLSSLTRRVGLPLGTVGTGAGLGATAIGLGGFGAQGGGLAAQGGALGAISGFSLVNSNNNAGRRRRSVDFMRKNEERGDIDAGQMKILLRNSEKINDVANGDDKCAQKVECETEQVRKCEKVHEVICDLFPKRYCIDHDKTCV